MNPNQFKYTITMTQNVSPSLWNINAMARSLVKVRNQAYDTEATLIEQELELVGLGQAKAVLDSIMSKK